MSGALQATFMNQRSFIPPVPVIGSAFGGGFFAGQISTTGDGVATHNLVIGPKSTAETFLAWKTSATSTAGTLSDINGPANTAAMISAGASAHPCGNFCNNLVAGGFSDWYMAARNELEICYFNLKPTTTTNNTSTGINPNAVPARAINYTSGNPAQTSAAAFQTGAAEAFSATIIYWSSTETSAIQAGKRSFSNGNDNLGGYKSSAENVRAVRRVPV